MTPDESDAVTSQKVDLYLAHGTQFVWVIESHKLQASVHSPEQTARTLSKNMELDGGDVLPGFRMRVGELF